MKLHDQLQIDEFFSNYFSKTFSASLVHQCSFDYNTETRLYRFTQNFSFWYQL